ncbi:class A beta-lactamase [Nocardiopsis sp. RSe5-2]|uniref:Class A beta-lactamase n=2 Tax=Nocardiopsis endophytica TaxID=3018445 RepID=A0ABT4UC24_9ACTN|nr:class A beta-lactamase [Nocardiopsis endophytica]MDA2814516.1 class A beta-lactamase [Nocardiopsis endophytica]
MLINRAVPALLAAAVWPATACAPAEEAAPTGGASEASASEASQADADFARLEEEFGARLGVYAIDTGSGEEVGYNADQRFAYASTFKALACGAVMEDNSLKEMEETVVHYDEEDLVEYSPITEKHVDSGMTLMEICDAAMRYSDNTAGNLLFEELGGPKGFQEAMRELGDDTTISARWETELNENLPGDERDTTSAKAFAGNLQEYVLGDTLKKKEREALADMMVRSTTGDALIRAGVPEDWKVGDKSGSPAYGGRNDIAVMWPTEGDPIVLAVYSTKDTEDAESDDALIAQAAEVAVGALED